MVRVLICDDHAVFRRGLEIVLADEEGIEVVGQATDTASAIELAVRLRPDVVLLDLRMPGEGGLVALGRIHERVPDAAVIVLTVSDDDRDLFAAVTAGAVGYLLKEVSIEEVGDAVRGAARGRSQLSPSMTAKLLGGFRELAGAGDTDTGGGVDPAVASTPSSVAGIGDRSSRRSRFDTLSVREHQTLEALARGLSNRAIAAEFGIAENTVKNHVRAVLEKLDVSSRTEAASLALRAGILEPH